MSCSPSPSCVAEALTSRDGAPPTTGWREGFLRSVSPSFESQLFHSLSSINALKSSSSNPLDLSIPPLKFVDLWRIEGEGPDIHLHQVVSHFPLVC